jgi:hypothetical protein
MTEKVSMAFCPPLPENHPRVVDAAIQASESILHSTACWRGYQGSWEIKEGRFYLTGLRGRYALADTTPLFADWFTGVLRVPRGKQLQYVHMGFGSVYEEELHIKIEKGVVVTSRVIDNRGKEHDRWKLGMKNLPGGENRFPGDDKL